MAIILLTVAIRLVLLPLTWKQTKSMVELQRIQPKIKELQGKYKDDKEKLQEETLKFYQENKVNPFGGCLPADLADADSVRPLRRSWRTDKPADHAHVSAPSINEIGTFYQIIPDISKTAQMVWSSHNYLVLIPYVLLVLTVRSQRLAAAGPDAWRQAAEDDRRLHGHRHAVVRLDLPCWRAPVLGRLEHLGSSLSSRSP